MASHRGSRPDTARRRFPAVQVVKFRHRGIARLEHFDEKLGRHDLQVVRARCDSPAHTWPAARSRNCRAPRADIQYCRPWRAERHGCARWASRARRCRRCARLPAASAAPRGDGRRSIAADDPVVRNGDVHVASPALRQIRGLQTVNRASLCCIIRTANSNQRAIKCRKSSDSDWDEVWIGANIATMAAGGEPYGSIEDAALAVQGRTHCVDRHGRRGTAPGRGARHSAFEDGQGLWITPGLIDCHTHLVYGGNRVAEFEQRLCGVSYEEIARAGGGIQSTVRATRAATHAELLRIGVAETQALDGRGRHHHRDQVRIRARPGRRAPPLEVARDLGEDQPVSIKTTFLGLHSLPPEFRAHRAGVRARGHGAMARVPGGRRIWWTRSMPSAKTSRLPLAETEQLLEAAQKLGLRAHVHAGQLSDMGAARIGRAMELLYRRTILNS